MFGLGRKPENPPVVVEADLEIEASIETVFALLDLASPDCALRAQGFDFGEAPEDKTRYAGRLPDMPDTVFHFEVHERVAPSRYVMTSWFESEVPLGALEQGHSVYNLKPLGEDRCVVELVETATLKPGLSTYERGSEDAMIRLAVVQDLMKLKLHAEGGPDNVPDMIFDFDEAEFEFDVEWDEDED